MRKFMLLSQVILCGFVSAQIKLSGTITSAALGEVLPGAIVYFPDLKNGVLSRSDGRFEIKNLPKINTLIEVKLIGYKSKIIQIDLVKDTVVNISLEESVIEQSEIVVTGVSKATEVKKNPLPMTFIDSKYLEQQEGTNVIDVLTKVPGVNAVSTGPGVSKPVIRGLGGNRILTLFDGIRQEGQQWGDEHGVEVDQFLIDRVEVVKGPASLMYGSDALGGVVNLLPANPPPLGVVKGGLQSNFQTNNNLRAGSLNLAGNTNGLVWGMRSSYKETIDYYNRLDGRVFNTGFQEKDLALNLGLNRKWGYSHFSFTYYNNSMEIPDGSRDSSTRKFTKRISETDTLRPVVEASELNSYKIFDLHQKIEHFRIVSSNNLILGKNKLALRLGYQSSSRREFAHPEAPEVPGLYLKLNTTNYDLKFYLPDKKNWESAFGINGMYQINQTNEATLFVIPNYSLFDFAPFIFVKRSSGKWDMAFGARYDLRFYDSETMYTTVDPLTDFEMISNDTSVATKRFTALNKSFSGLSGSFGLTYSINKNSLLKANVARGFRAPNISELSAGGVHPGTGIQQFGSADLNPEYNLQIDLGYFFDSEHISASAEVFNNLISNYIFNTKLQNASGGDSLWEEGSESYPVFKYVQTKARLYGGEARLDFHPHPLDWLHIENVVSMVYAENLGGGGVSITNDSKYLPLIPPLHTYSELRAEFTKKKKYFGSTFIKVGMQYYAAQNRAFLMNNTETKTPHYYLFDFGFGSDLLNRKGTIFCSLSISVTNLTDIIYQSNMSRLKYFEDYPNNPSGRSGIYGMGRNISFKIKIPIAIKTG